MSTIGRVSAVFTANTSGLVAGVNQACNSMGRMQDSASSLGAKLNTLIAIDVGRIFFAAASMAASWARSLIELGQAQAEVIDRTSKLAARTGMTYGQFAGLALAGELAGVGLDAVAMAATRADVAFVKARNGSAEAAAKFTALGLSIADLEQMTPDERFQAIAAAIARLPTQAERAAAAVALFGRSGAELLPMFENGAEGIAEARRQAERLGLALTSAQGRDVEAMNDAFTLTYKAIEGIVRQVTAYLSPALKAAADTFTNLVGDIGGANIGQFIGRAIMDGAIFLAKIADWVVSNLGNVWQYAASVGTFWSGVVQNIGRAAEFFRGVFNVIETVLGGLILAIGKNVEFLAKTVQFLSYASPALRMAAGSAIDAMADGVAAFNEGIGDGILENMEEGAAAFSSAFGEAAPIFGEMAGGQITETLRDMIARAEASAADTEEAGNSAADKIANAVASTQAVKGVDSRSKEGIAEMFRIMRGEGGNAQERTARATERTADGIERLADEFDMPAFDMAGA